jgi:hypothetical protein
MRRARSWEQTGAGTAAAAREGTGDAGDAVAAPARGSRPSARESGGRRGTRACLAAAGVERRGKRSGELSAASASRVTGPAEIPARQFSPSSPRCGALKRRRHPPGPRTVPPTRPPAAEPSTRPVPRTWPTRPPRRALLPPFHRASHDQPAPPSRRPGRPLPVGAAAREVAAAGPDRGRMELGAGPARDWARRGAHAGGIHAATHGPADERRLRRR